MLIGRRLRLGVLGAFWSVEMGACFAWIGRFMGWMDWYWE